MSYYTQKFEDELWLQKKYQEKALDTSPVSKKTATPNANKTSGGDSTSGIDPNTFNKGLGDKPQQSGDLATDLTGLGVQGLNIAAGVVAANDQRADPEAPASIAEQTLTYASMGASLGSVAGPWGTAIGAVVGGAYGAINGSIEEGDYERKQRGKKAREDEEQYLYGRGLRRAMKAKAYEMYVA